MVGPHKTVISKIPLRHSLRLRIIGVVILVVAGITILMSYSILNKAEEITTLELQHEGVLLSNALEAGIGPLAKGPDIVGLKNYIDRFVSVRGKGDLEINIILIKNSKSAIVASNNPGNIEETSEEEHADLLAALEYKQPIVFIGRDDDEGDEDDEGDDDDIPSSSEDITPGPMHPDYYLRPGQRFLSLTTPLFDNNRQLGSINIKLSLASLDQKLGAIRKNIFFMIIFGLIMILVSLSFLLDLQFLKPLSGMAETIIHIGSTNLDRCLSTAGRRDEFGALAREFNRMLGRIRTLICEMRDMADNIAHDLRSPITRIRGTAEITLTTDASIDEYKAMAADTIEECDNILTIINTMLYISETEAGVKKLEQKRVDIAEVIRKACELFHPMAEDKGITISSHIPPECTIHGNIHMLQRLVANLLDNALKYTPPQGKVEIVLTYDDRKVDISFADTGIGISDQEIPLIFKRFYRCDKSRSKSGNGLGLSLSRAIAKAHGGDISVSSCPKKSGSTFTVTLPRFLS